MESKKNINRQTDLLLLCFANKKENKNVVSGKFLYANTTSGYRTTPPRHSTTTVHRPHTEHLAHPFQR